MGTLAPCMLRVAVESAVRARQTDCPLVRAPLRDRPIARVLAPTYRRREPEQLPGASKLRWRARIAKSGSRVEGSSQMTETPTYYAGIDVAKDRLEVVLAMAYIDALTDQR
jgi:hypothetical protein